MIYKMVTILRSFCFCVSRSSIYFFYFIFFLRSDSWAAYNNIPNINNGVYMHDAINHRLHFVDPVNPEIHTNTIEGMWAHAKRKLRRQYGTSRTLFASYLDEFMWRWNTGPNKFGEMVNCIRQFYPV